MSMHEMIAAHPGRPVVDADVLAQCIEECLGCAATCTSCADACLGEDDPGAMVACIRTDLDCADVCTVAGRILARQGAGAALQRAVLETCAEACRICAEECERHAEHHEHCRRCAEQCRRCEGACNEVLRLLG
jgi:hypothetical protein